jgi:uncharacterized membrane protein
MRISTTEQTSNAQRLLPLLCIALIFAFIVIKISPLSLWLDECGTYWIIKDGLVSTIDRAVRYQGQSPLYYLIALSSLSAFGKSEFALRLPSLIAIALCAWVVWLVAKELAGKNSAHFAALLFLSRDDVLRALSARPYAVAVLCVLCSIYALLRWIKSGNLNWLIFYSLSSVCVWYSHFLFAPVGVVHVLMLIILPRHTKAKITHFGIAVGLAVLLALPGLTQFISLVSRKESLVVAPQPKIFDLLKVFFPGDLLVLLSAGALCPLAFIKGSKISLRSALSRATSLVLIAWITVPALILFGWSLLTGNSLFLSRYFIWYLPALSILGASVLGAFSTKSARLTALAVITILICVKNASTALVAEDWRGAARAISLEDSSSSPVLLYSGLVEANDPAWLDNVESSDYLTCPFSFYPVPGKVMALPPELSTKGNKAYFASNVLPVLVSNRRSYLVTLERRIDSSGAIANSSLDRFNKSLKDLGFDSKSLGTFGQVYVASLSNSNAK